MDRFLYDNGLRHERVNAFLFSCDEMLCPLGAFHQKNLRDAAIIFIIIIIRYILLPSMYDALDFSME